VAGVPPITDVRDISRIGYGFMASQALFAALELDVFGRLADGPKSLPVLADETGVAAHRLVALLSACVGLGLLGMEGDRYVNAPASASYLVRSAPMYFGDYFRFQIARQIYPTLAHLDKALAGERVDFYAKIQDPRKRAGSASPSTRARWAPRTWWPAWSTSRGAARCWMWAGAAARSASPSAVAIPS
jgi:hypothetical protein